jgi:nucleoside-diphosphate-sugar epimerase
VRVLFTGASSFTGMWFVAKLADRGHEVLASFRGDRSDYQGIRARRVTLVEQTAEARYRVTFGDARFMELLENGFDVLCHHGATVADYRSPNFDVVAALAANTRNASAVANNVPKIVVTGSVFEQREGAGEPPLRAFSPYGLSKGITADALQFYATSANTKFAKFVIPNPFGPYEEPRFTTYLARSWLAGEVPRIATPAYVRDNIHVSLLADAYARFVEDDAPRAAPSGYIETQGAFARRFARELEPRLGVACPLELAEQTDFIEPRIRINTEPVGATSSTERTAWDDLANYYLGTAQEAAT